MIGTGIIIEKAIKILAKQFKLDKILDYVEKPNELDDKVEKLEARINRLELDSHPKKDFVMCDICKNKIKERN
jgi:hypothetical protein